MHGLQTLMFSEGEAKENFLSCALTAALSAIDTSHHLDFIAFLYHLKEF